MRRYLSLAGLLLVMASCVFGKPSSRELGKAAAPEIDAGFTASALTLLSGAVLMLRARKR
jgi:hypothetical protein